MNRAYINTGVWSPINAPRNQYQFEVVHTPAGSLGQVSAKFVVHATKPVSGAVTAGLVLDNAVAEAYNTQYNTEYHAFPEGVLSLENTSPAFGKDRFHTDSVVIAISPEKLVLLTEPGYVAAVRLNSVSDPKMAINEKHRTVYVVVRTSTSNIKPLVGPDKLTGTLITDYSGWTASSTHATTGGQPQNIFSSSTSSFWGLSGNPATITIDMGSQQLVEGLRLFARYSNFSYRFNRVSVETSVDGIQFEGQGAATASEMALASNYQYIGFYAPVNARHLRLTLEWNSTYTQLAVLNVYKAE